MSYFPQGPLEPSEGAYPKGFPSEKIRMSVDSPLTPVVKKNKNEPPSQPKSKHVVDELEKRSSNTEKKPGISKQQVLSILKQTAKILVGIPTIPATLILGSAIFLVASGPAALIGAIHGHLKMRHSGYKGPDGNWITTWSKERQGAETGVAIAAIPLQGAVRLFLWMANMSPNEGKGKEILSGMRHGALMPKRGPDLPTKPSI